MGTLGIEPRTTWFRARCSTVELDASESGGIRTLIKQIWRLLPMPIGSPTQMSSEGLEPSRPWGHWLLGPARMPFRHNDLQCQPRDSNPHSTPFEEAASTDCTRLTKWQRWDSNPRFQAYEARGDGRSPTLLQSSDRDLNPEPSAYQTDALPVELSDIRWEGFEPSSRGSQPRAPAQWATHLLQDLRVGVEPTTSPVPGGRSATELPENGWNPDLSPRNRGTGNHRTAEGAGVEPAYALTSAPP